MEISTPATPSAAAQLRLRRETLESVLDRCQRALELLKNADQEGVDGSEVGDDGEVEEENCSEEEMERGSSSFTADEETDELRHLLKSKVESQDFLEKLGSCYTSAYKASADDSIAWDFVKNSDLWEDKDTADDDANPNSYVFVRQEDIVEGIACFMAAYLLSLKETKELTPVQLQDALAKTFSVKKKKSKLRKAWDGSKVIYNVASWGATAVGIYQNPAILKIATAAFWSSCRVMSKFF